MRLRTPVAGHRLPVGIRRFRDAVHVRTQGWVAEPDRRMDCRRCSQRFGMGKRPVAAVHAKHNLQKVLPASVVATTKSAIPKSSDCFRHNSAKNCPSTHSL